MTRRFRLAKARGAMGDLTGLMAFINRDDSNKEDFTRTGGELSFTNRRTLAFSTGKEGTEEWSFTDHSFEQLCKTLKIPSRYLKTCSITGKGSMQDQIEARMEDKVARHFFVRVRRNEEIEGVSGIVRAILPGTYEPFDNRHLLESVRRAMKELGTGFKLEQTNAQDPKSVEHSLHFRFTSNEEFQVSGDPHKIGFHTATSEVGAADITVAALVWRLVCSNGMMGWGDSDVVRLKHRNLQRHEVFPQLHEGILASVRQEDAVKAMLERSMEEELRDPEAQLLLSGRRMRISDSLTERALELYREDKNSTNTRFSIIQAFTAAARELPIGERVTVEETIGGFAFGAGGRPARRQRRIDLD